MQREKKHSYSKLIFNLRSQKNSSFFLFVFLMLHYFLNVYDWDASVNLLRLSRLYGSPRSEKVHKISIFSFILMRLQSLTTILWKFFDVFSKNKIEKSSACMEFFSWTSFKVFQVCSFWITVNVKNNILQCLEQQTKTKIKWQKLECCIF